MYLCCCISPALINSLTFGFWITDLVWLDLFALVVLSSASNFVFFFFFAFRLCAPFESQQRTCCTFLVLFLLLFFILFIDFLFMRVRIFCDDCRCLCYASVACSVAFLQSSKTVDGSKLCRTARPLVISKPVTSTKTTTSVHRSSVSSLVAIVNTCMQLLLVYGCPSKGFNRL